MLTPDDQRENDDYEENLLVEDTYWVGSGIWADISETIRTLHCVDPTCLICGGYIDKSK